MKNLLRPGGGMLCFICPCIGYNKGRHIILSGMHLVLCIRLAISVLMPN